jgi:hypothetical protein
MVTRRGPRSPHGTNVKLLLQGLGIRVLRSERASRHRRLPNVVYGRARTIARLARQDEETLIKALRCIQASDATALHSDVVLAVYRYIRATGRARPLTELLGVFEPVPLTEIRALVVALAKGEDGRTHAARVEGLFFMIANNIKERAHGL